MAKKQGRTTGRTTGPPPVTAPKGETAAVRAERSAMLGRVAAGELSFVDVHDLASDEAHKLDHWNEQAKAARRGLGPPPKAAERPSGHRPAGRTRLRDVLVAMPDLDEAVADRILDEYEIDKTWRVDQVGTAEAMMFDSAVRLIAGKSKPETARRFNEPEEVQK